MEPLIRAQVFICYSHAKQDKEAAKAITKGLLMAGHEVWIDELEIFPGDSLFEKISVAITDSSYLLVLLSPNSVSSNWVNRELEIALSRQLKDKSIKVIPCVIDDCEIPPFLEPITYADFRKSYEDGMAKLLPSIKKADLKTLGKFKDAKGICTHDYTIDWNFDTRDEGRYTISVTIISHYVHLQGNILFTLEIKAADELRKRFDGYPKEFSGAITILQFIQLFKNDISLIQRESNKELGVAIQGPNILKHSFDTVDMKGRPGFIISTTARYLGDPLEKDLVYFYGQLICDILDKPFDELRKNVPQELGKKYLTWLDDNPMA